ncbi:hypothetical protein MKW98_031501, partial [Papaver atlanticum]
LGANLATQLINLETNGMNRLMIASATSVCYFVFYKKKWCVGCDLGFYTCLVLSSFAT